MTSAITDAEPRSSRAAASERVLAPLLEPLARPGADAFQIAHSRSFPAARSADNVAIAAPESQRLARRLQARAEIVRASRDHERGGRVERRRVGGGARLAAEHGERDLRIPLRIAAREVGERAQLDADVACVELGQRHDAVAHDRHGRRAAGRELIDSRLAVHHHAVLAAELREGLGHRLDPLRCVDADQLAARAGGVGERAEQVEDRAHAERLPHRPRVAHGGVMGRGVQVAEAVALDHLGRLLGREVDRHAERFEQVGRARARRGRAVAVLGHRGAAGSGDERRRGGDVERAGAIAAGARRVDQVVARRPHGDDVRAHRASRADELVDRLALGAQRHEQARDLGRVGLAAHHERDHFLGVPGAQGVAREQTLDGLRDHAELPRPRKLRAITSPEGVSTDSGWNCTPWRWAMSRWRSAMTSPSRSRAVATSTSGSGSIAASEW